MGFFDNIKDAIDEQKKKLDELDIEELKKKGEQFLEETQELATTATNKISEISDSMTDSLSEIQESSAKRLNEIAESTSQKLAELKVEGGELYDTASKKIGEAVDSGIETVSNITVDDVVDTGIRGAKLVSGVQAYQDREKANNLMEQANAIKKEVEEENEKRRIMSNTILEDFGNIRLKALKSTVGVFVNYMKKLQKNIKDKEYEIDADIDIKIEELKELETIEMNASEALKTTMAVGTVAGAALTGVPAATTAIVGSLCAASTGTAISTLSGAAATNATLAWLGGGAISAGGGGMAAGATVLTGITYASTGIFALAAAGIIAGAHYSKKHTEATEYLAQMQEYKSKMELAWTAMGAINQRANELKEVTIELKIRIEDQLKKLADIIDIFDKNNDDHMKVLQQTTLMVKSMSELSQVSLIDENGNLNEQSGLVKGKVNKVLNNNL